MSRLRRSFLGLTFALLLAGCLGPVPMPGDDGTASAYKSHLRLRTSVRKSVLSMQRIILPRMLSLIG
jgi:uncharacterized lipoprotein YbaY